MNRITAFLIAVSLTLFSIVAVQFQFMPAALTMSVLESSSSSSVEVAQLDTTPEIDFGRHFQNLGVEGSILIYDLNNDQIYQHNSNRNATAFLPGSTFKILNSLISLETGVIPEEIAILTWDGVPRLLPEWNRDLNMREAFKLSAVWFYQVLARRVGHEQMQKSVIEAAYGNQKIGGQEDIDQFWLEGELRITPQQQIQFLRRLYENDLPFSERSLSLVKDIMIVEQTPNYTIRAKSGWVGLGEPNEPQIGWYVGYLEKDEQPYFFATNTDIRNDNDPDNRMELMRLCFADLGLL